MKSIALWRKMEDFRIDVLVENKVIPTREKHIQILSLLSHKHETMKLMTADLDREKKEGDDEVDFIFAKAGDLPCYLYDGDQNLVTAEVVTQEFLSLMDQCMR